MIFFFIWLCQNRSFCQILPNWNFLFYLKCRFKTVDLIELLSFISNMKKSYQMFFYQRKFDRMSRRTGKCFDQNCMSRICYEMLVCGSLGRKGEHGNSQGSHPVDFQVLPHYFIWIWIWLSPELLRNFPLKTTTERVFSLLANWEVKAACTVSSSWQSCQKLFQSLPSKQHVVPPCASCFVNCVHENMHRSFAVNLQKNIRQTCRALPFEGVSVLAETCK